MTDDTDPELSDTDFDMENGTQQNKSTNERKKMNALRRSNELEENRSKTRKIQHNDIPGSVRIEIPIVPISNRFQALQNAGDEVILTRSSNVKSKKGRIPPIVIPPPANRDTVVKVAQSAKVASYKIKLTSTGFYLFVDSVEDHQKIRQILQTSNVPHFSHDLPDDRVSKVVLKGLDRMETTELKQQLKDVGFEPTEIKIIEPKKSRYSNHVNYLLYFKRGATDLKKLYSTRVVNHTIVNWEPYRSSRGSTTQCRRCQRFGHGTRHCQMPFRCSYCADKHDSSACPSIKVAYDTAKASLNPAATENPIEVDVLRTFTPTCCNCKGAHLASDPVCPEKHKYRQLQSNLAKVNKKKTTQGYAPRKEDFPAFSSVPTLQQRQVRTTMPSYSQILSQPQPGRSQPTVHLNVGNDCSGDLFSFNEVNLLLSEVLQGLSNCKSKLDQFKIITELAIKYVYNDAK